jgi:hypothetical protein
VSLRREMHAAFDELLPNTAGMADRMVREASTHSRRPAAMARPMRVLRAPLTLVAVLLLIALVVGALAGGRLVRDWQHFIKPTVPVGINMTQLHQLEARAFVLPSVKNPDQCPPTTSGANGWWGKTPVYVHSWISSGYIPPVTTSWGVYYQFHAESQAGLTGPLLVRARDLVSGRDLMFVGLYATGPASSTDNLSGTRVVLRPELALDADHPLGAASGGFVTWGFDVGINAPGVRPSSAIGSPFCTGWQVDGRDFTETFVIGI